MTSPMQNTRGGDSAVLRLAPTVVAAAHGDTQAFGRLVEETRNVVCAITLAITRDVTASEDVAQDVYLQAWQGLPRLRNAASFLPWLRELARNRARMALRGALRRRRHEEVAADDGVMALAAAPAPDALTTVLDEEERAALAEALAAVPDGAREVLVLYYREEQSVRQVAELIGITENAVKQRLARARQALRAEYLARTGEALRGTAPGVAFVAAVSGAILAAATPGVAAAATLGGSSLAITSGAAAKLGKLGVSAAASATVAGGVAGLGSGLLGIATGTRRMLAEAKTDGERAAIRRAGVWQSVGITVLMTVLLFTRSLTVQTLAFVVLLVGCAWLHFRYLPRTRGVPAARDQQFGFALGALLGALPFVWLWWRALA